MFHEPRVSIIIPAYNEGDTINACLDRIEEAVSIPCEIIVVYDREDDTTAPFVQRRAVKDGRVVAALNTFGPGPANAIRFGFQQARAAVGVVTMADGSDDPQQIDDLVRLVERGVVVACASRYMPGGQQVDAPALKAVLSRAAGLILWLFARVGTRDATNSFKAYDVRFVRSVDIDSRAGFEIGIEMVAKARRLRLPVAEIPTIWLEREMGSSNFRTLEWLPHYLNWFLFAFGRQLGVETLRLQARQRRMAYEDTGDWRGRLHRRLRGEGAPSSRPPGRRAG